MRNDDHRPRGGNRFTHDRDTWNSNPSNPLRNIAGRAALTRAAPVYLAGIAEHFTAHLTPAEQDAIACGLQRVIDAQTLRIDPRR
jgi:hypothetical protein